MHFHLAGSTSSQQADLKSSLLPSTTGHLPPTTAATSSHSLPAVEPFHTALLHRRCVTKRIRLSCSSSPDNYRLLGEDLPTRSRKESDSDASDSSTETRFFPSSSIALSEGTRKKKKGAPFSHRASESAQKQKQRAQQPLRKKIRSSKQDSATEA